MKLIPVCSGKGGVGKSCVCAYTAAAMAALGKKTLLIDLGGTSGSLATILGAQDAVVFNVGDVLSGECEPEKAILSVEGHGGLYLLPAGLPPDGAMAADNMAGVIKKVQNDYEFIFLDNPDFLTLPPSLLSTVLLVITPDTLSLKAAAQKNLELCAAGAPGARLVINNVPARVIPMKSFRNFDDLIDLIGAQLIAVIPSSQKLYHSANNGLPLSRESLTVQVFECLAARLLGKQAPLLVR